MNLLKILLVNLLLLIYGIGIIIFLIKPQGFIGEFIHNYKKVAYITIREEKIKNKINYLKELIKNYKNKDSLTVHFVLYYKFNYLNDEYEEYK